MTNESAFLSSSSPESNAALFGEFLLPSSSLSVDGFIITVSSNLGVFSPEVVGEFIGDKLLVGFEVAVVSLSIATPFVRFGGDNGIVFAVFAISDMDSFSRFWGTKKEWRTLHP